MRVYVCEQVIMIFAKLSFNGMTSASTANFDYIFNYNF